MKYDTHFHIFIFYYGHQKTGLPNLCYASFHFTSPNALTVPSSLIVNKINYIQST